MRAAEIRALAVQAGIAPGVSVLYPRLAELPGPDGSSLRSWVARISVWTPAPAPSTSHVRAPAAFPCRFEISRIPPIPRGPFDVVLLFETMLAFPEKETLLQEISRALTIGGRFAFTMEEGLPLTEGNSRPEEHAPTPTRVWLTPLQEMLTCLERVGLHVRWQADCSRSHRAVADSLINAFTADATDIAGQIGRRALEELLATHRLWSDWLREGRFRKIALVAEKTWRRHARQSPVSKLSAHDEPFGGPRAAPTRRAWCGRPRRAGRRSEEALDRSRPEQLVAECDGIPLDPDDPGAQAHGLAARREDGELDDGAHLRWLGHPNAHASGSDVENGRLQGVAPSNGAISASNATWARGWRRRSTMTAPSSIWMWNVHASPRASASVATPACQATVPEVVMQPTSPACPRRGRWRRRRRPENRRGSRHGSPRGPLRRTRDAR